MIPNPHIRGIRPVGDRGILVELPGIDEVLRLHAFLTAQPSEGQVDVVAAAETVLVTAESTADARKIAQRIRSTSLPEIQHRDDTVVEIDTVYDGADLATAAELAGMSPEALVAMHSGEPWTAAFGGFAPGFAYLVPGTGTDPSYPAIARRRSPRTSVPAGSVAMAGHYSAVYPGTSPGGWQLIGRTTAPMWDPGRDSPALVNPGNRVQFRPVRELVGLSMPTRTTAPAAPTAAVVRSPGPLTTVQDLGRPGLAGIGVTGSGALDRAALRRANRLVGNQPGEAGLETVLGGLVLEALQDLVLAVAGAPAPLTIAGTGGKERAQPVEAPFALLAGETLELGRPASGFRSYIAFRGGLGLPRTVASRSTDLLSGTGPAPVMPGFELPVGRAGVQAVGNPEFPVTELPDAITLGFVPGPRSDWFTQGARASFAKQLWRVSAESNRIGLRLEGEPLERLRDGELVSEGTVSGTIQVPPSGLPVLFLADHPVTGGYPVIGVVLASELDKAAQLPPGSTIRFEPRPDAGPVPLE